MVMPTPTAAPSAQAIRELSRLAGAAARAEILDTCLRAAQRTNQRDIERLCEAGRQRVRQGEAAKELAAAKRAGGEQRFTEALTNIEAALALEPLGQEASEMYLRTAIYASDARAEVRATQRLRLLGVAEGVIQYHIRSAQEKRATTPDKGN